MSHQIYSLTLIASIAISITSCGIHQDPAQASYLPLVEIETTYGSLITAGNHPTPDQNGTGDRIGLFRDVGGTVWGLPVTVTGAGAVLACVPPTLHDQKITDTYPLG